MSATEYRHPGLTLEQRVKAYLDSPIGAPVTRGLVIDLMAELTAARAGVVAEEPEWETEQRTNWGSGRVFERKVTPWVPVKQEGAEPSGLLVTGLLQPGGDADPEQEDARQPEREPEPVNERDVHPPRDDEHEQEQGADEQVPVELHTDDSTPDGRHTGMKQERAERS